MNSMGVYIHRTAKVSEEAEIGDGTYVLHQAQVREGARVGRDCRLGKGACNNRNVVVGDRYKIQNGASFDGGVQVAVFIPPHVVFTNDLYPRAEPNDWEIMPTHVRGGASIGANATILCGFTIGSGAVIGVGSVVTEDVPDHGVARGNPARLRGYACHCGRPSFENMHCSDCGKEIRIER